MKQTNRIKRDYYIMPFIFATASFVSIAFLTTSGTLQILQGGYHEGFSILTAAFPAFGAGFLMMFIWFTYVLLLTIRSKSGELIVSGIFANLLGFTVSFILTPILLIIGSLLATPLSLLGFEKNMMMPIDSLMGAILGIPILIKSIRYIHMLIKKLQNNKSEVNCGQKS